MARQFGLCQPLLRSFYKPSDKSCLWSTRYSEDEHAQRLQHFATDIPIMTPVAFKTLFYTTKEFYDWWIMRFVQSNGTPKSFKARLKNAFEAIR